MKELKQPLEILYCNNDLILNHLAESIFISGFPMDINFYNNEEIKIKINNILNILREGNLNNIKRAKTIKSLGGCRQGEGHDSFLKGICFNAIISAPSYWFPQMQRYHFLDIISSQSKMHRITKMDIKKQCIEEVDDEIINVINKYVALFNKTEDLELKEKYFRKILANCPMGLKLTCGITTNYLQLKGIYHQRKNHKLIEWREDFIKWVETLPYFKEIVLGGKINGRIK